MKADPNEYVGGLSAPSRFPLVELLIAAALIIGLVIFWFWSDDDQSTQAKVEIPPITATPTKSALPATPDIPERVEAATVVVADSSDAGPDGNETGTPDVAAPAPLTPEQGDDMVRRQVSAIGANKLANTEHPLEISAALLDGLSRGLILRKMLPADPPKEAFSVTDDGDAIYISATSYLRYDAVTDALTSLDSDALVNTFHTLRPLYEQAYEHLGLESDDFDNAVIRTLDLVLATPEIGEPIEVKPKSAVYVYADASLESLPAVQKLLLRMGPDNLRQIKKQARMLREGLLAR